MERGIEVAKGRCRIGIDPFDAVALEKSVGFEVDGAEAFGNVGFLLAAECRKEVGGKFAFQMQFVNASSKLTTIGGLGIAITAILLLFTIENSFNFIFKVKKHRRLATKITLYWTIITLCPLLVGTALSLKGYLITLKYFHPEHFLGYNFFVTFIVPNIITFVFLWLSYVIVPNKKIRVSSAFSGACVTLILTLLLRFGFSYFLVLNVTYRTLYGALATVPILLVWMYSWWTIVLFGAVVTATIEEFRNRKSLWK